MIAIVAVDRNYAIGRGNSMLYHLPEDLKHFARTTRDKVLVMGRATLESFPGGKPLPKRVNIVLSRNPDFKRDDVMIARDFAQLKDLLMPYQDEDVMLLGGDSVYHALIDCCKSAIVTKVDAEVPADKYFPNLDEKPNWELVSCTENMETGGYTYRICEYRNKRVLPLPENESLFGGQT